MTCEREAGLVVYFNCLWYSSGSLDKVAWTSSTNRWLGEQRVRRGQNTE